MLRLASTVAAFAVAQGTLTKLDNECYDFWNKLEEAGVADMEELAVNIGANIQEGALTAVGNGAAINAGNMHFMHVMKDGNTQYKPPEHTQGRDGVMGVGIGANIGLEGSQTVAVESGAGTTLQGGKSQIEIYKGDGGELPEMYLPTFGNMNGGLNNIGNGMNPNANIRYLSGVRRRLMANMCGPPPAKGGAPVTCASTGDPHISDFHGRKFDLMSFGEFIFYNSWEPFSHHPQTNLKIHVRTGPYNGNQRVAANHGVAIAGRLTCGNHFEIYKEGRNKYSVLKIRRRNGQTLRVQGKAQIYATLAKERCPAISIQGDVAHFVFEQNANEDRTTLRVQIVTYGLNLGLDVLGQTVRLDSDRGVCTKNAGWDMQLECSHSMFTEYPTGSCQTLQRTGHPGGPPQRCPTALFNQASARCHKCPETVHPKGCVYDVCAAGDISAIDDVLAACRVGARLPKRMYANVGGNINMKGSTMIAAGAGLGLNYGDASVRIVDATQG